MSAASLATASLLVTFMDIILWDLFTVKSLLKVGISTAAQSFKSIFFDIFLSSITNFRYIVIFSRDLFHISYSSCFRPLKPRVLGVLYENVIVLLQLCEIYFSSISRLTQHYQLFRLNFIALRPLVDCI